MAESDVAVAPPEISPANDQTQESAPPSEMAVEEVAPSSEVKDVEKETKETVEEVEKETKEEEAQVESENPAAGEETGQGNPDLKRKLEVQEEMEKQAEEVGNGEDGNEGEKEREGSEAKRQKTETEEIEKSGEVQEGEPPVTENLEHDINTLEQTAEGDVQRDDFHTDKTGTADGSEGSEETSRIIEVPNHRVGVLIGKSGDTIRNMQKLSGARIQIVKDAETAPDATTRAVELLGSVESIEKAEQLIKEVLAEADAGRPPPLYSKAFNTSQSSTSDVEIQVPNEKVGSIIGKGGQMIKDLQARSGAHILLLPTESSEAEDVQERTVRISGNKQQIEAAKHMIMDVVNQTARPPFQNRGAPGPRQSYGSRGPSSYGYGSQKQWGPPRHQSHSPGFSKYPNQRGKNYPQQFPQNPRQNYGKYPPARSGGRGGGGRGGGMGSSWDQRAPYSGSQPPQYGASGGPQYGQQPAPYGYGAPNPYQQSAVPPQQSYPTPPSQQYYGQQGAQAGYPQQTYNSMYPQGQAPAGTYGAGATAQQQNPYAGQYGQAYSQPVGADGYAQQYSQYPQQPGQAAAGYSQAAPAAYNQGNYGYQGAAADPATGYNAGATQAGYGQAYEQPVAPAGYDQGAVQPAAAGTTAQAGAPPVAGGQWQG